jgi:hypothetical protein
METMKDTSLFGFNVWEKAKQRLEEYRYTSL